MKIRPDHHNRKKKRALTIVAVLAVVALTTYGAVAYMQSLWPFHTNSQDTSTVAPPNTVNYDPPTEQEIESSQDGKKNSAPAEDKEDTSAPEGTLKTTPVAIAFASVVENSLEVRAFASQVIEGSGTCTATLTKGGATVTKTSQAFIDASSSQCQPILIPTSQFNQSGTWYLTVNYTSSTYKGISERIEVAIP